MAMRVKPDTGEVGQEIEGTRLDGGKVMWQLPQSSLTTGSATGGK